MAHEHIPVLVPEPFLNPGELQNMRDDEIEMVTVCLICSARIPAALPIAA